MVGKKNPEDPQGTDAPESMPVDREDSGSSSEPMVRWMGEAGERRIEQDDWAQRGIPANASVWDAANGHAIPKSEFTQEQLQVLSGEPGFVIEE